MGLYLCVFEADEEVDGVEVGQYADFNAVREYVIRELEGGNAGARFPTLVFHSDCDGEWSPTDCQKLVQELAKIVSEMSWKAPVPFASEWQRLVAKSIGLFPRNAFESFIDVDGEYLLERIQKLTKLAVDRNMPILFQ